jgi:hypothetical protein
MNDNFERERVDLDRDEYTALNVALCETLSLTMEQFVGDHPRVTYGVICKSLSDLLWQAIVDSTEAGERVQSVKDISEYLYFLTARLEEKPRCN